MNPLLIGYAADVAHAARHPDCSDGPARRRHPERPLGLRRMLPGRRPAVVRGAQSGAAAALPRAS